MASHCTASRGIASLSSRPMRRLAAAPRGYRSCPKMLAAQNFTMPAMSPTMTEGNIASWKVNEGDSFSAGDVLLEVMTDKGQVDVEAQDDGKMARITQHAGSEVIKVGTRIAVIAESDDDLNTLSLLAEESAPKSPPQEDLKSAGGPSQLSESQAEAPPSSKAGDSLPIETSRSPSRSSSTSKIQKQTYPLYPSIVQLLHQKGVSTSEADKIPASGPKGRLLKGDVLAYLGGIKRSYSSEQSARISKLGHLDLSNVKPVPTNAAPSLQSSKDRLVKPIEPEPIDTEIAIPISLSSVLSVQKRVQKALGVTVPLSIFIARATELANDDLPRSTATKPTANELFDDILGLANVRLKSSRGSYTPQITALPNKIFAKRAITQKHPDVYDILAGKTSTTAVYPATEATPWETMAGPETGEATNVFSVSAARGEEQRARVFLERVKTILQVEPGRLVL